MKSRLPDFLRLGAACAAVALFIAGQPLRAESDEDGQTSASIKFSDPAKPGTLKALLPWADVRVTGADVAEITVVSSLNKKHAKGERREDGLRRLDEEVSFELTEKDNVVVVQIIGDTPWGAQGSEFEIKVPRSTNLVVRTEMGGDVHVENVAGDIDINSMNGEVVLRDIASSAIVNTMNGEISAFFSKVPQKPVSLSSMNGEIELRLPGDTKANLRMRTHNGSLLTDFDEDKLVTKAETRVRRGSARESEEAPAPPDASRDSREAARIAREVARDVSREVERAMRNRHTPGAAIAPVPAVPAIPAIMGGKSIVGTLNGGGIDIQLASMNGTITVRQTK